jgi:hypothetical protein
MTSPAVLAAAPPEQRLALTQPEPEAAEAAQPAKPVVAARPAVAARPVSQHSKRKRIVLRQQWRNHYAWDDRYSQSFDWSSQHRYRQFGRHRVY